MSTSRSAETVAHAFLAAADARANYPALRAYGGEATWTWTDYRGRVRDCAAGLVGLGCVRGDTLACWLRNRPESHVADMAAAHLGLGSLSIYPSSTADEAARVLSDARCRVLVTEKLFLDQALQVRASPTTQLQAIVCLDGGNETTLSWPELIECEAEKIDLGAAAAAVTPDDVLTVIYSFATAGPPTLVRLTHADVIARIDALGERVALGEGWRVISWQPIADIAERLCAQYLPLAHGWHVTTCAEAGVVAASLPEIRPEFFWAQPSLWEEMRASVLARFHGDRERAAENRAAVLAGLGFDQLRLALVAASCPPDVVSFWRTLGVPLNNEELCSQ